MSVAESLFIGVSVCYAFFRKMWNHRAQIVRIFRNQTAAAPACAGPSACAVMAVGGLAAAGMKRFHPFFVLLS